MFTELKVREVEEKLKDTIFSEIKTTEGMEAILDLYNRGYGILIIAKALNKVYGISDSNAKRIVLDITKETRFDQLDNR